MKKLYWLVTGLICMYSLSYAKCTPPEEVLKSFRQKFPQAGDVVWDKENAHEFEAEFKLDGQKYSANFNDKGDWLETESPSTYDQLPEKVKTAISSSYKNAEIEGVSNIINHKGEIRYEVELEKWLRNVERFYTEEGIQTEEK